jgi:hypothetical protein
MSDGVKNTTPCEQNKPKKKSRGRKRRTVWELQGHEREDDVRWHTSTGTNTCAKELQTALSLKRS